MGGLKPEIERKTLELLLREIERRSGPPPAAREEDPEEEVYFDPSPTWW